MNEPKLQALADKYGFTSSWAIWNPDDFSDLSVIESNHLKLFKNIVMVGLNVSADIKEPWQNFHVGPNDRKLMKAFNDTSYRGAYMTDLIKDHTEAKSDKLLDDLTEDKLSENFKRFYKEMETLGADKNTLFLLFGNQVKELFLLEPVFHFNNIVCCMHYAYYGITKEEWIRQTHATLLNHYQKTKDLFDTNPFVAPDPDVMDW